MTACSSHGGLIEKIVSPTVDIAKPDSTFSADSSTPLPVPSKETQQSTGYEMLNYRIISEYPHDSGAFIEGLVYHNQSLYETTGLKGRSSVRKVDLESGRIQKICYLSKEYFGEGMAIVDQKIIWVTWQSNTGFVLDLNTFEVIDSFSYNHEGWGLTYNGVNLYLSDGTDTIHILDPLDFHETGTIQVQDGGVPVDEINELEYVDGVIYANIWKTTHIIRIDPETGNVTGWLDLSALKDNFETISRPVDVLNGIAYNAENDTLFVTGKFWPKLYEIQITTTE